jgi:hypothetical protein
MKYLLSNDSDAAQANTDLLYCQWDMSWYLTPACVLTNKDIDLAIKSLDSGQQSSIAITMRPITLILFALIILVTINKAVL